MTIIFKVNSQVHSAKCLNQPLSILHGQNSKVEKLVMILIR